MPPTAPDAALTTTVSPPLGSQIVLSPIHAVTPGIPTAPRYADSGTCVVSTLRSPPGPSPATTAYSCQPPIPTTLSPATNAGERDSTTSPTVPPIITSPIGCGAAYDF